MGKGITLFRQVQALLPWGAVAQAVADHDGDYKVQKATCRSQVLVWLLALLLKRQSLRDIETGLRGRQHYLTAFGVGSLDHNTLSHANRHRPAAVAEALFTALLAQAAAAAPGHPGRFRGPHYTLDATEIQVSARLYEWACCAPDEAGIKLHVFLDHAGGLPCLVEFATLKDSERTLARRRTYAPGSLLCFDRGYFDSAWFGQLTANGVRFVTRLPANIRYTVLRERPVTGDGVLEDQQIRLCGKIAGPRCALTLRLITFYDAQGDRILQFLTNQLTWAAAAIAALYKARWEIERFFKWLKQNLRLTHLLGRTENAVRWQVLMALSLYLLLALLKYRHGLQRSLHDLHASLGLYLFDTLPLQMLWDDTYQFQT
jgi:putative transposase